MRASQQPEKREKRVESFHFFYVLKRLICKRKKRDPPPATHIHWHDICKGILHVSTLGIE